jgi:hypothetical protein
MSAFNLRRAAPSSGSSATLTPLGWRRREVVASAIMAVSSLFIGYLAWSTPMSVASRLLDSAAACGGLAAACAPRLLFLPTALRELRGAALLVPRTALRLAQLGRLLLLAAAGCWLGSMLSS